MGGRALWSIPKDLATFGQSEGAVAAAGEDGRIASLRQSPILKTPGVWPLRSRTYQDRAGQLVAGKVRARGRVTWVSADWRFEPGGPLAFMQQMIQGPSLQLSKASLTFGG